MSLKLGRITRYVFLLQRDAAFRRAKSAWQVRGANQNYVVVEPHNSEILCDFCNVEITSDDIPVLLNIKHEAVCAICEKCVVNEDGKHLQGTGEEDEYEIRNS